jgi:hypothetical protein
MLLSLGLQIPKTKYPKTSDTLRDVQISIFPKIFQVSNRVGPKNKALEKKGESIDSDSPFLIAITSEYRSKFQK